jgi:ABC-2 type transport system permease protein
MNEALLGVSADADGLSQIANHFWFLLVFTVLMAVGGWLSYRRMLMVERRL